MVVMKALCAKKIDASKRRSTFGQSDLAFQLVEKVNGIDGPDLLRVTQRLIYQGFKNEPQDYRANQRRASFVGTTAVIFLRQSVEINSKVYC